MKRSYRIAVVLLALGIIGVHAPSPAWTAALFGLSGNGTAYELRAFHPPTGTSSIHMTLNLQSIVAAASAFDRSSGRLYQIGVRNTDAPGTLRLLTINTQTKTVVSDVVVDRPFANLQVRNDGTLIGLTWNGFAFELKSIATTTGVSTLLGTVPGLSVLKPSANAINGSANRLYQAGHSRGRPTVLQLFILNTSNGAFVDSLPLDRSHSNLQVRGNGGLLGVSWNGMAEELRVINTTNGTSSLLASMPGFALVPPAANTINTSSGILYQTAYASMVTDPTSLLSVNGNNGTGFGSVATTARMTNLRHSPASPTVGVQVGSFSAEWVSDHVEVSWTLLGTDHLTTDFEVRRRKGVSGEFELVTDLHVVREPSRYVFHDKAAERGAIYFYRVSVIEGDQPTFWFETSIRTPPAVFALLLSEPNPFVGHTRIHFSLDRESELTLQIFDLSGRLVHTLVSGRRQAGLHVIEWDGRDDTGHRVRSGTYFSRLRSGSREDTRKMMLVN